MKKKKKKKTRKKKKKISGWKYEAISKVDCSSDETPPSYTPTQDVSTGSGPELIEDGCKKTTDGRALAPSFFQKVEVISVALFRRRDALKEKAKTAGMFSS